MTVAQRSRAHDMIARKGQTLTISRQADGGYNPATGSSTVSPTTQTGKGVIFPFGVGLRNMAGTTVTSEDRQCILSGLTTSGTALAPPKVNDTVTDSNAVVWTVTEVSPLAPAGMSIIYELTLRGAS